MRPFHRLSLTLVSAALIFGCGADTQSGDDEASEYGGEGVDAPVTASDLTA